MAAKQGLTAQLSQASEDAKRAVLSRTGVTASSWFANLNTVCTIKSAPPKTPEVLQMLSTKSGWLWKRNEQHVWQPRWCCVVPHMFLYYFDAAPPPNGGASSSSSPSAALMDGAAALKNPTSTQQEEWNAAIAKENRKQHEKRSNFYLFGGHSSTTTTTTATVKEDSTTLADSSDGGLHMYHDPDGLPPPPPPSHPPSNAHLQPAGIIDLECYTSVHRCSTNHLLLELAGDDLLNPDLRAFYFSARSTDEADDWTDAVLNGRHSALLDECDAYKQVCDGFAQQLQELHGDLDQAKLQVEASTEEVYRVRSQSEESRRTVYRQLQESLERAANAASKSSSQKKLVQQAMDRWEKVQQQDLGLVAAVQVVCDFGTAVHAENVQLSTQNASLEAQLNQSTAGDQVKVQELQAQLAALQTQHAKEKALWEDSMQSLSTQYQQSQQSLKDVTKELHGSRMEMTMNSSQNKNKMLELKKHKGILKNEVLELRKKLEAAQSELNQVRQQQTSSQLRAEQEQTRNQLLERYVEKMETQVKVQQNMMELISHASGVASVHNGGSIHGGSVYGNAVQQPPPSNVVFGGGGSVKQDVAAVGSVNGTPNNGGSSPGRKLRRPQHQDEFPSSPANGIVPPSTSFRQQQQQQQDDDYDMKSHVSELTEDRTQRQFEAFASYTRAYHGDNGQQPVLLPSPRMLMSTSPLMTAHRKQEQQQQQQQGGPPRLIMGGHRQNGVLETIHGSVSLPPTTPTNHQHSAVSLPPTTPTNGSSPRNGCTPGQRPRQLDECPPEQQQEQRMSVAQRARLQAERQSSTPVRIRMSQIPQVAMSTTATPTTASTPNTESTATTKDYDDDDDDGEGPRQGLWQRMEEAVLGPRPDGDGDAAHNSDESFRSTRYEEGEEAEKAQEEKPKKLPPKLDLSDPEPEEEEEAVQPKKALAASPKPARRRDIVEEKKQSEPPPPPPPPTAPPSPSLSTRSGMSLAERMRKQREGQMSFLKKQGLVKDEARGSVQLQL